MFWNSGKYLKIQYTQNYKRLKRKKKRNSNLGILHNNDKFLRKQRK